MFADSQMGEIESESPAPFEDLVQKQDQPTFKEILQKHEALQQQTTQQTSKPTPYSTTGLPAPYGEFGQGSQRSAHNESPIEHKKDDFEESDDEIEDIEDEFDNDIEQDILPDKPVAVTETILRPQINEKVETVHRAPT